MDASPYSGYLGAAANSGTMETFSYGPQDLRTLPPALGRQPRLLGLANRGFRHLATSFRLLAITAALICSALHRFASWARETPRAALSEITRRRSRLMPGATLMGTVPLMDEHTITDEYISPTVPLMDERTITVEYISPTVPLMDEYMITDEYISPTVPLMDEYTITDEYISPTMVPQSARKRPIHVMHDDPAVFDSEIEEPPRKTLKLEPTDHPMGSSGRSAGGLAGGRWTSHPTLMMEKRPLPYRCPPFPKGGGKQAIRYWNKECRRISALAANDPNTYPPILSSLKGINTANAASDLEEKNLILRAADFIASISSIGHDGAKILKHTGIIINACESSGRARILTCSHAVCDDDGRLFDPKPLVYLANRTTHEGELIFVDDWYQIAVLEIWSDKPLRSASLSHSPVRGSSVFALARNEGNLQVATGKVLWADEPWLARNYYMYLSCEVPEHGTGGPIIDKDGIVTGMSFDLGTSNGAVLPSSVIMKCIEMQTKFSRIALPMHGLSLRTVEYLDLTLRDEISYEHNISAGYLVQEVVPRNSTAEILGIRHGDIIVSFDGLHSHTLVEIEEHLLSLGSEFLEKKMSSEYMVVLELQVYSPLEKLMRDIRLPVGFEACTYRETI